MEPVFQRFNTYDFEADLKFQEGLKVLNKFNSSLLDTKLFFYNRFVEPIDQTQYKLWSSSHHVMQTNHSLKQLDQSTPSDSDSDFSKDQTAETEATKLSFAEVMQLLQEGREVPGAIKLDIKPSNQSPTPSQMERILKPWETAASPK